MPIALQGLLVDVFFVNSMGYPASDGWLRCFLADPTGGFPTDRTRVPSTLIHRASQMHCTNHTTFGNRSIHNRHNI